MVTKYRAMLFSILFVLFPFNEGCAVTSDIKIQYPRFSPTNDKLIFNYCRPSIPCTIGVYEFAGRGLYLYEAPENEFWVDPNYSSDGRQITLVVGPRVHDKRH